MGISNVGEIGTGTKRCVYCGEDCTAKPRVRDPQGRYYCAGCYAMLEAKQNVVAASVTTSRSTSSTTPASLRACPSCRQPVESFALVCVGCGHDLAAAKLERGLANASDAVVGRTAVGGAVATHGAAHQSPDDATSGWIDYLLDPGGWIVWVKQSKQLLGLGAILTFAIAFVAMFGGLPAAAQFTHAHPTWTEHLAARFDGWAKFLLLYGVGATLLTVVYWFVGPWWFRVRVAWAGGQCDEENARIAYFSTLLPYAILMVPHLLLTLLAFRGPVDPALHASAYFTVVAPVFGTLVLIVASVHLWIMATRGLGARPDRAALALIALPAAIYIGRAMVASLAIDSVGGAVGIVIEARETERAKQAEEIAQARQRRLAEARQAQDAAREAAGATTADPDVSSRGAAATPNFATTQHTPGGRIPVRFTYRADWSTSVEPLRHYQYDIVSARSREGWEARVHAYSREDFDGSPIQALDQISFEILKEDPSARMIGGLTRLGSRDGVGREYRYTIGARTVRGIIFAPDRDGSHPLLIVEAVVPDDDQSAARAVVELIATSVQYAGP